MKLIAIWLGFVLSSVDLVAQQTSAAPVGLTSQESERIQQQAADLYGIDRSEALSTYKTLFSANDIQALHAADFFDKHKAYEVLASALPSLDQPTVHHHTRDILLEKRSFSRPAADVLIAELDQLSAIPVKSANEGAESYFLQGRIVKALSRWLDIADPRVDFTSRQSVAAFSAFAKQKAATTPNSTPFV